MSYQFENFTFGPGSCGGELSRRHIFRNVIHKHLHTISTLDVTKNRPMAHETRIHSDVFPEDQLPVFCILVSRSGLPALWGERRWKKEELFLRHVSRPITIPGDTKASVPVFSHDARTTLVETHTPFAKRPCFMATRSAMKIILGKQFLLPGANLSGNPFSYLITWL